jgi:hypothetical protein
MLPEVDTQAVTAHERASSTQERPLHRDRQQRLINGGYSSPLEIASPPVSVSTPRAATRPGFSETSTA